MLSALCAPLRAALADTLSLRQQSIVAIAASAATGALEHLRTALARGLDGGADCERGQGRDGARLCLLRLSPQLAWFAAPLMQVLDERKARGIADTVGRDAQARLRQPRQAHPRRGAARKAERRPCRCAQGGLCRLCPHR